MIEQIYTIKFLNLEPHGFILGDTASCTFITNLKIFDANRLFDTLKKSLDKDFKNYNELVLHITFKNIFVVEHKQRFKDSSYEFFSNQSTQLIVKDVCDKNRTILKENYLTI